MSYTVGVSHMVKAEGHSNQGSFANKPDYKVIILGTGFAGIGMGARLKDSGENAFLILEKANRIGGTWRDNHYPGAGCDVPSHLYSYSFAQNPDWSRIYSRQPEILKYIEDVASQYNLASHIRFNAEVVDASWDNGKSFWSIRLASGETITTRVFISAWGQLNRPAWPGIPGIESFNGVSFHSAQWRHDIDLKNSTIAVVGNGASAVQFIPQIAPLAKQLIVFQRSANYIVARQDKDYTDEERVSFRTNPSLLHASRKSMYDDREARVDKVRLGTNIADATAAAAIAHLHAQVPDERLRQKLTPDYPVGCKRILISDDFYPTFMRENVELITDRLERLTSEGVQTVDGNVYKVDVMIFGTGFATNPFLGMQDIRGRDEASLRSLWQDGARAYLGMAVAGFPNLFMLYGPNTNLGHNSVIAMLEAQINYILQALEHIRQDSPSKLEVKKSKMESFDGWVQGELAQTAWSGNCSSWYKTGDGRIVNNWPGTVEAYTGLTSKFDLDDYVTRLAT